MYKLTEEQHILLADIMESLAIPQEHKSNIFWCPKVIVKVILLNDVNVKKMINMLCV